MWRAARRVLRSCRVDTALVVEAWLGRINFSCSGRNVVDDSRFDEITRVLGGQSARRGMLKAAAGGVLGLVGLAALTDGALARDCTKDKDCPPNKLCHNKKCVECATDRNCSDGQVCVRNQCIVRCKSDNDCGRNEFCVQKECVECRSDRDCSKGQKCSNGGKCK
jgi:Cys-rich repeat protein